MAAVCHGILCSLMLVAWPTCETDNLANLWNLTIYFNARTAKDYVVFYSLLLWYYLMKLSLSVSWRTYQPGTDWENYGTLRCNCLVLVCKSEQRLCFIDWVMLRDIYKVAIIFSTVEHKRKLKGVISTMSFALLSKMMTLFQTAGSQITKAFYYIAVELYRPLCGC